jgi:8-amino-7-oxononanoate synthase
LIEDWTTFDDPCRLTVPPMVAEVSRLILEHPMADAVVEEIDGRRIRVGGHWVVDFASCNYLRLDLDPEVIAQVPGYLARWGTHPSWAGRSPAPSRTGGSSRP